MIAGITSKRPHLQRSGAFLRLLVRKTPLLGMMDAYPNPANEERTREAHEPSAMAGCRGGPDPCTGARGGQDAGKTVTQNPKTKPFFD